MRLIPVEESVETIMEDHARELLRSAGLPENEEELLGTKFRLRLIIKDEGEQEFLTLSGVINGVHIMALRIVVLFDYASVGDLPIMGVMFQKQIESWTLVVPGDYEEPASESEGEITEPHFSIVSIKLAGYDMVIAPSDKDDPRPTACA